MRDDEITELQERIVSFVRAFGLLTTSDRTPCGVTLPLSQAHALIELSKGPMTQRALTESLRLERSSISRLVDRLQDRGWVHAVPEGTGRGVLLTLTDRGQRAAAALAAARVRRFTALLEAIPAERRQHVREALELLTAASAELEPGPEIRP